MAENSKIMETFLVDSPPKQALEKATKIVNKYGDFCTKFVWAPNCSGHHNPIDPPSGFSMAVKSSGTPLYPGVFSPTKMFFGTIALPLDDVTLRSSSQVLTEDYLIKNLSDVGKRLNMQISQTTNMPIELETHFDPLIHEDKAPWKESLSGGGSYAGIYASSERNGYSFKNRLWLVVQSGNTSASQELYRMIEDAQPTWDVSKINPAKDTWNNFFFNNKQTTFIWNCVQRTRERLMASIAEAMNLNINFDIDPFSKTQNKVLKPMISTISYNLSKNTKGKTLVYHAATVSPSTCNNGIIFSENPYIGPTILKGPEEHGKEFGGQWHASEQSCGAFPTGTGRLVAFSKQNKQLLSQMQLDYQAEKFVWDGKETTQNIRLAQNLYRQRDIQFKKVEHDLGYNHIWGEVHLKPVLVKICTA